MDIDSHHVDMVEVRHAVAYFTNIDPAVSGHRACYLYGKTLVDYTIALRNGLYQAGERVKILDQLESENKRLKAMLKERNMK